jgi:hypothetical protein
MKKKREKQTNKQIKKKKKTKTQHKKPVISAAVVADNVGECLLYLTAL